MHGIKITSSYNRQNTSRILGKYSMVLINRNVNKI